MTNHKHRDKAIARLADDVAEEEVELEQHTLPYPAKVDPQPGMLFGPSRNGTKVWKVLGSVYNAEKGKTYVTVEEYRGEL